LVKRSIRVLLADDQTMFREGLAELLTRRAGMEVVGQTTAGPECVTLVRETKPDAVIMQVDRGVEEAKRILSELLGISPPPMIAVVTTLGDPQVARELLELGASAYLLKDSSVEQLIGAIRAVALAPSEGGVLLTLPQEVLKRAKEPSEGMLSEREMEILLLAARGLSNRQIAASLNLAEATVKRHLVNVYAKMKVGSRTEAINKALSEGWFTLGDLTRSQGS
jgi:DNA-binding NarL/FixJ family response regulator